VPAIHIHSGEPRAHPDSRHPLIGGSGGRTTPTCYGLRAGQGRAGAAGSGTTRNGGTCGGGTTNRSGAGAKVWIGAGVAAGAPTGAGAGMSEAGKWLSITAPTTTPPIVQAT
jgi:hypothetical protein